MLYGNLVVALAPEAKPLIAFYKLKRNFDSRAFELYSDKTKAINLIVSGIGKIAMSAAVSYLHHYLNLNSRSIYLNIGIAGAKNYLLGEARLAHKIKDSATLKTFYPTIALLRDVKFSEITTFDLAQSQYPEMGMVDMEASAFFQVARMFVPQELVHCLKIISDRTISEMNALSPSKIEFLIEERITEIDKIFKQMRVLQKALGVNNPEKAMQPFLESWHFSFSQKNQLWDSLRQWQVLFPDQDPWEKFRSSCSAKELLFNIQNHLKESHEYICLK